MKKHYYSLFILFISIVGYSQSIPNGGFESWNTTTYENPLFYQTSNLHGNSGAIGSVNALKTSDSYHGNYAIKLTTTQIGIDTNFAYFANGDPGQNPPMGGIPYNQIPTGIRLHYKSNIIPGDSSLVLVQFKKAGILLAQYFWAITTSQSSYTVFNKNLSPALSTAPDTVIIGIASSFPFGSNRGKPGNMLQVDSVLFTGVASQPANFNGDLESWQTFNNSQIIGWNVNGNNVGSNFQTSDSYSGTYALELQTQQAQFGGGGVQEGMATTGHYVRNGPPAGGLPYSRQIDTLVFFYKYLPADPNDSARVDISFSRNSNFYYGVQKFLHTSGGYQMVQIPFSIPSSTPDSVIINLTSSSYTSHPLPDSYAGSDLKVDNMYFKSQRIPVANFSMPPSGCVGQPIQLLDKSSNMVSGWNWIMSGGSPSSSILQNPQVTYSSPGIKTITLYATNVIGSTNTSPAFSRTITVYSIPSVNATSTTICNGSSGVITANGATSFTWNTGQNTASISVSPTVTTSYTVVGSTNGCLNSNIGTVTVPTTQIPNICEVTVDSLSHNNEIYWDKTLYHNVDSFIVYRETTIGNYSRIAALSYTTLSMYVDTNRHIGTINGNPNISHNRYQLQILDSCGNYSAKSPYHSTIFIQDQLNGNFNWDNYAIEGTTITPVTAYTLKRRDIGTGIDVIIGSSGGSLASDPNYFVYSSFPQYTWYVDAQGFSCNATFKTNATKNRTKSNHANDRLATSLVKNKDIDNTIAVYPNPTNENLMIDLHELKGEITIAVKNVIGQILVSETTSQNKITLNVSQLSRGVYFINVLQAGKTILVKKIIKD